MAYGHASLLKRGKPRRVAPPPQPQPQPQPEPAPVRLQGSKQSNNQDKKTTPAGLRPNGKKQNAALAACGLSTFRDKAWSKRPDRQASRHGRKRPPLRGAKTGTNHARPTSRPPAQPGACARHAEKVCGDRKTLKTGLSGKRQVSTASKMTGRAVERPQERRSS